MSEAQRLPVGSIAWRDLTVERAEDVRAFYEAVVGWQTSAVGMGDYDDYNLMPPGGEDAVAGICHARGPNAGLPPQWLIYIVVEDVDESAARCVELGGTLVSEPKALGPGRFCVIRDPAGAVCALYEYPH